MAALTEERPDIHERSPGSERALEVAASTEIFAGGGMVLNGGWLEPASTATGLISVGRAEESVDNSSGANGDKRCRVRAGIFNFKSAGGGDLIDAQDIGADCYWVDDQTVGLTDGGGTRSFAGKIWNVDADGVWVRCGIP